VLSPGPGKPKDFDCKATIKKARAHDLPIFGVCLGCRRWPKPMAANCVSWRYRCTANRPRIRVLEPGIVFSGLGKEARLAVIIRSCRPSTLPRDFMITAESDDGTIMVSSIPRNRSRAVQFHPESIMTLGGDAGMRMIENVVAHLAKRAKIKAA